MRRRADSTFVRTRPGFALPTIKLRMLVPFRIYSPRPAPEQMQLSRFATITVVRRADCPDCYAPVPHDRIAQRRTHTGSLIARPSETRARESSPFASRGLAGLPRARAQVELTDMRGHDGDAPHAATDRVSRSSHSESTSRSLAVFAPRPALHVSPMFFFGFGNVGSS